MGSGDVFSLLVFKTWEVWDRLTLFLDFSLEKWDSTSCIGSFIKSECVIVFKVSTWKSGGSSRLAKLFTVINHIYAFTEKHMF